MTPATDFIGSHSHPLHISGTTESSGVHNHNISLAAKDTGDTGGGAAHNNIQPSMVLNYIIKAIDP